MILIRLALLGALLFGLVYAGLFVNLFFQEKALAAPPEKDYEAMIVLGAQVNPDGQPSKQLELRLGMALRAYEKDPMPIVVCGAQGENEPMTEAEAMREWLLARGVNPLDIKMDMASFNTAQNIQEAIYLLPEGTKEVLIITSDYHLPRALAIARDLSLQPEGMGSAILPEYWWKNHLRETMAWGKYYVNKYLPFIPTP